jgi:hypothetical protein
MAKKEPLRKIGTQENCGRRKELAAAGVRTTRCVKVARGREHGRQRQGRRHCPENPERTNGGGYTFEGRGMQKWRKVPRPQTAVSRQNGNKGSPQKMAAASYEREDNQKIRQEGFRTGVRKASKRDIQRFKEIKEMDPLRNGKRDCARSKSRISGSTGYSMSYSPHFCVREREKKTWDDCVGKGIREKEKQFG